MMESSPLAAMQPPPLPMGWGCRRDVLSARSRYAGGNLFGSGSFNFKDLSMARSQQDYFSGSHVRGSSPAASLAADLSQNFHIDQRFVWPQSPQWRLRLPRVNQSNSPQLPTPRRSLFTTTTLFHTTVREGATTPPVRWEGVTTPPIPSSSPGFGHETMDMSPLPHKMPYPRTSVVLPTPAESDSDMTPDDRISSPYTLSSDTNDTLSVPSSALLERRKSVLPRPSLLRSAKFFSTGAVLQETRAPENQLPPFKFGAGIPRSAAPPSLDDIEDSPVQQRSVFDASRMGPVRPRQIGANSSAGGRLLGSPLAGVTKKSACPVVRPRKQFRRSNSMFEHPGDVMKQEKEFSQCSLPSIMDVDDTHKLALPHFIPTENRDGIPRISQETMVNVLDGQYKDSYDRTMVVDCRFEYEFSGGHIDGAVNHNDKEGLTRELFSNPSSERTLLILHCEFSAHRAPLMAEHIRRQDRKINEAQYPKLTYPDVYILDGGYQSFFKNHYTRCYPQNYVEMDAEGHEATCEREMEKLRRRGKLNRAVTYAFGQVDIQMEDSPTAPGRTVSLNGLSRNGLETKRSFNRRMASY